MDRKTHLLFQIYFNFMSSSVLPECVKVSHMCTILKDARAEKQIPGIRVMDNCELDSVFSTYMAIPNQL